MSQNILVEKISLWQLAVLIFTFELGSTVVVSIGQEAKQDAWVAASVATVLGVLLTTFYLYLLQKVPGKNLFEIYIISFGKWIGKFITFLYVIYFFYIAARVIRDFCELIVTIIFSETPLVVIAITMVTVIIYMVYLGLEVMARTGETMIPYVFSFIVLIAFAIFLSGEIDLKNLQPILAEGWGPVIKVVFPNFLTFPFGEMIAFMVIIPYVSRLKKANKVTIMALFLCGVMIIGEVIVEIGSLTPNVQERVNFPFISAARKISLLDFIERVDLVVVFIVMFTILMKASIFFYAGLKGLESIINIPYRPMVFSIGMILNFFIVKISGMYAEHIYEGLKIVPLYMHIPFQIILPVLLLPALMLKLKRQQKGNSQ